MSPEESISQCSTVFIEYNWYCSVKNTEFRISAEKKWVAVKNWHIWWRIYSWSSKLRIFFKLSKIAKHKCLFKSLTSLLMMQQMLKLAVYRFKEDIIPVHHKTWHKGHQSQTSLVTPTETHWRSKLLHNTYSKKIITPPACSFIPVCIYTPLNCKTCCIMPGLTCCQRVSHCESAAT